MLRLSLNLPVWFMKEQLLLELLMLMIQTPEVVASRDVIELVMITFLVSPSCTNLSRLTSA